MLPFAAVAALTLTLLAAPAQAQVKTGDTISRINVEKVSELVSPGVIWAIENGMDINVIDYEKVVLPKAYTAATEKYSGQARVDENNDLKDWVAGRPFPVIPDDDPQAAAKVMWNFQRTHYFTDDLNVHLPDADTGSMYDGPEGNRVYQVERHFIVDWSRRVRFTGRIHHEPIPAIENNPDGVLEKSAFFPLIEPFDLKGVGTVGYRYLDYTRHDDTWLYTPVIRRVRRLSSAQRSDALFGQDIDLDSFGGFAGTIPWFEWKLLGKKPMLASLHGVNLPPVICERDGGATYCESWEIRPEIYVVEGVPKLPGYAYSKRVIFMDKESFMIPYSDLYDNNGELWKLVLQNIRSSTKPNPNADLEYDEERQFVYGFSVLDTQLEHATRAAIPGMQFPEEPAWYLDIGFDHEESAQIDWYTVASLISAGR